MWDANSERCLLLLAISELGNPGSGIWPKVAEKISVLGGGDLNGSACSYGDPSLSFHSDLVCSLSSRSRPRLQV